MGEHQNRVRLYLPSLHFLFYSAISMTFEGFIKALINWIWVPSSCPTRIQHLWIEFVNTLNAKGFPWKEQEQCWKWFSLLWPHCAMTSCRAGWSHLKESQSRFTILACSKPGLICSTTQIGYDADSIETIASTALVRNCMHKYRAAGSQLLKIS